MIGTVNRRGAVGDVYNNGAESSHRADYTGTAGNVYNNEAASSRRAPAAMNNNLGIFMIGTVNRKGTAGDVYNHETESSRRAHTVLAETNKGH